MIFLLWSWKWNLKLGWPRNFGAFSTVILFFRCVGIWRKQSEKCWRFLCKIICMHYSAEKCCTITKQLQNNCEHVHPMSLFIVWSFWLFDFREPPAEKNCVNLGGRNLCANCLWQSFTEYKWLLRHIIFIIFHQYLIWFLSEYHIRIILDYSHFQNIDSQCQNWCFKNFLRFGEKHVPELAQRGGSNRFLGNAQLYMVFVSMGLPLSFKFLVSFQVEV